MRADPADSHRAVGMLRAPNPISWLAGLLVAGILVAGCDSGAIRPSSEADAALAADVADSALASDVSDVDDAADEPSDVAAADSAVSAAPDALPDAADPWAPSCPIRESRRPAGALRPLGCRWVRNDDREVIPRAVVVGGDSLDRVAGTPLHEPAHYDALAAADVRLVRLVVTWEGVEPMPGVFNGAYLGRVCEQAKWATDAGLEVVLTMYQDRFGPALGGHGAPAWATPAALAPAPVGAGPDHPSVAAAWAAFWTASDRIEAFEGAWLRILRTCGEAGAPIAGLTFLTEPSPGAGARAGPTPDDFVDAVLHPLRLRLRAAAEAEIGPFLHLVDGPGLDALDTAADVVYSPTVWGPGRDFPDVGTLRRHRRIADAAGRPFLLASAPVVALPVVEAAGVPVAVWHDGFGGDGLALRNIGGAPTATWNTAWRRTRPDRVAGRMHGFGIRGTGFFARWTATSAGAGLTTFELGPLALPIDVTIAPAEGIDWFAEPDPVTRKLTVFVGGTAGVVEIEVSPAAE